MKKQKKMLALLLAVIMMFSLVACGSGQGNDAGKDSSGNTEQGQEENAGDDANASDDANAGDDANTDDTAGDDANAGDAAVAPESLKIGVILTFTSNGYGLTVKQYLDNIGKELNVEFQYAEAQEVEDMTSAMENFITSGVNGIITMPTFNTANEVELAASAGVYYTICGSTLKDDVYASVKDNPYYVGAVGNNDAASTEGMIKVLAERYNCKDFGLVSLPMGTSDMHDGRYEGTKAGIEATGSNLVVEALAYNLTESSQNVVAQYPDLDCIIALAGGIEECMQPIIAAGKGGEILFAGFREEAGAESMFEEGTLACLGVGTPINALFAFMNLYNAISGTPLTPAEGEKINYNMDTIYVCDAEEYLTYVHGAMDQDPYTADQIKEYLGVFNPDATYADMEALMSGYNLDYLKSISN